MKKLLGVILSIFLVSVAAAQELKTKNIIVVTLDGYRWQELFTGADPEILAGGKFAATDSVFQFNDPSPAVRRQKLTPFLWNTIGRKGQLYGNRSYKNKVNCTNIHLFSYPGYHELFVGYPDASIHSNDKIVNPNSTVFEFIHEHHEFKNKVAAFATWDAFSYIFREKQSGILVNDGNDLATGNISRVEKYLNENQDALKNEQGARHDEVTFRYAMEFLKRESPRVLFIGFDETDYHAHGGRYDEYLKSAHSIDAMLAELWQWVQSQPGYKDQTTLFITTDHGRGNGKRNWKHHRLLTRGSRQTWFAVIGPDTPSFGEMKFKSKYRQKQVAKTIAAFIGLHYKNREEVGEVIQTMLAVPSPVNEEDITSSLREP